MASTLTKAIILLVVITIILSLAIAVSVRQRAENMDAEMGLVTVTIDGETANLTARMDIKADVDRKETDLEMDIGDGADLEFDGRTVTTTLEEEDFREMVDRDSVNISGKVKVNLFGPFSMKVNMEKEVNISFIHELSDTLNVSNVQVNFSFFDDPTITFDIDANVSRDFHLDITNTSASLTTPSGKMGAFIEYLEFRTGEGGSAKVSIPPLNLLGLAFYNRGIIVEAWGIEVEVDIPFFNG